MCGINAIILKDERQVIDDYKDKFNDMAISIEHRGESNLFYEYFICNSGIFGTNRLGITSSENDKQPIFNERKNLLVIFNGEIYNSQFLKERLISKNHIFETNSDTEVLVHLFEEYGNEMVKHLDGMFAFLIYDIKKKGYLIARDHFGIKPLYFAEDSCSIAISSEIKGLSKGFESEIREFNPGSYKTKEMYEPYYRISQGYQDQGLDEIKNGIRLLFDEAVKKMVQTDEPICVFFSGGIDSASVLYSALKYHDDVTAIIYGKPNSPDRLIAERYCKEKNIPYIISIPNEIDNVDDLVYISESFELDINRHIIGNIQVARTAGENGFKIALVGEGSDELFGGYSIFKEVDEHLINDVCHLLVNDLHRTELQRVDRGSMHSTIEARVPFLDLRFVEFVMGIPGKYKIRYDKESGIKTDKWILRQAMKDRFPEYIWSRKKEHFCAGAGLDVNDKDSFLSKKAEIEISNLELIRSREIMNKYELKTKEELMYFNRFMQYGFGKAKFNFNRILGSAEEVRKRIL